MGGAARRAAAIESARSEAEHVLVLDAGNSLLHNLAPAKTTRGQTSIEVMNLLGYDAVAIGGMDVYILDADELQARIAEAEFPMLSANVYKAGSDELIAEPYTVIDMADHKVGILGLTDVATGKGLEVRDPVMAAATWIPELRHKADIIVLLSHAGEDADARIKEQVSGIDVFVSGRDMSVEPCVGASVEGDVQMGMPAATYGGAYIGRAKLRFDRSGRLLQREWENLELMSGIGSDTDIEAWVAEARKR